MRQPFLIDSIIEVMGVDCENCIPWPNQVIILVLGQDLDGPVQTNIDITDQW